MELADLQSPLKQKTLEWATRPSNIFIAARRFDWGSRRLCERRRHPGGWRNHIVLRLVLAVETSSGNSMYLGQALGNDDVGGGIKGHSHVCAGNLEVHLGIPGDAGLPIHYAVITSKDGRFHDAWRNPAAQRIQKIAGAAPGV